MDIKIKDLYDLSQTRAAKYLEQFTYPWEALAGISEMVLEIGKTLPEDEFDHPDKDVWIAKDTTVAPTASITGPCVIGHNTQVRPGAFIRGSALIGDNCVVGNSTEIKNVIIFNNCQVPHYNYVGDAILGFHAHMGAGSITSNVKADNKNVVIKNEGELIETGRRKVGAMLGDYADIGCGSVLNPGVVIGRHTNVYPLSCVRGVVPPNSIYKDKDNIVEKY